MAQSPIATAADYADAMLTARRAKNTLFLILILILMAQLAIFLTLRQWPAMADLVRHPDANNGHFRALVGLKYVVAASDFLGVVISLALGMVLLLIVGIMLVGRLIGVARVTSAFIWCLVLAALLFPWQSLLSGPAMRMPAAATQPATLVQNETARLPADEDFKIPGVLYTWGEITHQDIGANFKTDDWRQATLHWSRYLVFPVVAMIILLMIQVRSSRGLRLALGEADAEAQTAGFHSSP